jgi:hypothetical protein
MDYTNMPMWNEHQKREAGLKTCQTGGELKKKAIVVSIVQSRAKLQRPKIVLQHEQLYDITWQHVCTGHKFLVLIGHYQTRILEGAVFVARSSSILYVHSTKNGIT